jgi:hypothetical protein
MTDRRALAVLLALHLAIVALVQPRGDFPLNDDWAYAHSVQWLLAEGRIRLSDWVGMNLVPQTLAGGLVVSVAGFSFEALRHLTQAIAVLAMAAAYFWFRAARLAPGSALVATAALVAFPAWPVLANSYMTDLYGLALALPAATLFLRALEEPWRNGIVTATALSAVGVLERQVILVLPFAFMVAWLWTRRPLDRAAIVRGVAPFAAVVAVEAAFHAYLVLGPGLPSGHLLHGRVVSMSLQALRNEGGVLPWILANFATLPAYLGFFAIGWLAWWGMGGTNPIHRIAVIAGGIAIAIAAFALGWFPPYRAGYVIDAAGIGPFLLYDSLRGLAPLDRSAGILWRAIALPAAFATAALVVMLLSWIVALVRRGRSADPVPVFALVVVVAYVGPFLVTDYFDRYLLYVLPFLFVLWARWGTPTTARWRQALAAAWIISAIVLSAVATRDYFSWNRARWDAIRMAERLGAGPDSIDGGYEYNADRRFEKRAKVPDGKSWWWVADDRYVVAFSEAPGYDVVETWKVRPWLPRSPSEVKLLRRRP